MSACLSLCLYHVQAKKFDKAVAIMGRNQWWDKLNQVVGQLPGQNDAERTALRLSAAFFRKAGQTQFAKETYVKLHDYQASLLCISIAPMVPIRPWRYSCSLLFAAHTKAVKVVDAKASLPLIHMQYLCLSGCEL